MTRHTVLAGFALAAVVALGSFSSATDQPLRPTQAASAPNGFPVTRSSRPLDEEAERIKRLTVSLEQSRAAAEQNETERHVGLSRQDGAAGSGGALGHGAGRRGCARIGGHVSRVGLSGALDAQGGRGRARGKPPRAIRCGPVTFPCSLPHARQPSEAFDHRKKVAVTHTLI